MASDRAPSSHASSANYLHGGLPSWFVPDAAMEFIGFKLEILSADLCQGRLVINERNQQALPLLFPVSAIVPPFHQKSSKEEMADAGFLGSLTAMRRKFSSQPFGVLHGGVSCIIAESLASYAASAATGFQRVAGIELKINHLRAAPVGAEVVAAARPLHLGKNIHVWDVTLSKVESSVVADADENKSRSLLAVARVTLMVGLGRLEDHDGTKIRARI